MDHFQSQSFKYKLEVSFLISLTNSNDFSLTTIPIKTLGSLPPPLSSVHLPVHQPSDKEGQAGFQQNIFMDILMAAWKSTDFPQPLMKSYISNHLGKEQGAVHMLATDPYTGCSTDVLWTCLLYAH